MSEFVRPGIQKVLKSYHQRAPSSLKGPGLALIHPHKKEVESPELEEAPPTSPMGPPPPLPHPILSAPDNSCGVLYRTELEGRLIGCFLLGGEMRLCLPQVYHVLKECSFDEINRVIEYLGIDCSQCTPSQLHEFKAAEILPEEVKSCGLITRTNAERLCSILLHRPESPKPATGQISFMVYTNCFDKCEGICSPDLFSFKDPACIQCTRCQGWFSPQRFVCHAHKKPETYTCHWGFNSNNWRSYIQVDLEEENREQYLKLLDKLRDRELQEQQLYEQQYRDQREREHLKRRAAAMEDSVLPPIKSEPVDIPAKKAKVIEEFNMLDYHRHLMFLRQQQLPFFMPIPPPPSPHPTKGGHLLGYPMPPQFSEQFAEPPVLQNPERVVRLSESQRFESSFQPNVALAPRKKESKEARSPPPSHHSSSAVIKQEQPEIKQEPPGTPPETPPERFASPAMPTPTGHHLSNTPVSPETTSQSGSNEITSSTSPVPAIVTTNTPAKEVANGPASSAEPLLVSKQEVASPSPPVIRRTPIPLENIHHRSQISPHQKGGITHIGTGELELSTDTDEESVAGEPDSSSRAWDQDLLKELRPEHRDKLLAFMKQLITENGLMKQMQEENASLKRELQSRGEQIEQLLQKQDVLRQRIDHYEIAAAHAVKVAEASVIAARSSSEATEGVPMEHRNGFHSSSESATTPKPTSEIIIKPFKKSLRRSPEDTVVIMQPKRDEIKIMTNGELVRSVN